MQKKSGSFQIITVCGVEFHFVLSLNNSVDWIYWPQLAPYSIISKKYSTEMSIQKPKQKMNVSFLNWKCADNN